MKEYATYAALQKAKDKVKGLPKVGRNSVGQPCLMFGGYAYINLSNVPQGYINWAFDVVDLTDEEKTFIKEVRGFKTK